MRKSIEQLATAAATEYASHVSTNGRVLVDMFIGSREFGRVTDIVHAAFKDGFRAGAQTSHLEALQADVMTVISDPHATADALRRELREALNKSLVQS